MGRSPGQIDIHCHQEEPALGRMGLNGFRILERYKFLYIPKYPIAGTKTSYYIFLQPLNLSSASSIIREIAPVKGGEKIFFRLSISPLHLPALGFRQL